VLPFHAWASQRRERRDTKPANKRAAKISSLTVKLSEVGYGSVDAIGAMSFRDLCLGQLEIALVCPDAPQYAGTLQASFMRSGAKLAETAQTGQQWRKLQ